MPIAAKSEALLGGLHGEREATELGQHLPEEAQGEDQAGLVAKIAIARDTLHQQRLGALEVALEVDNQGYQTASVRAGWTAGGCAQPAQGRAARVAPHP